MGVSRFSSCAPQGGGGSYRVNGPMVMGGGKFGGQSSGGKVRGAKFGGQSSGGKVRGGKFGGLMVMRVSR